jgi:hypothetical protein
MFEFFSQKVMNVVVIDSIRPSFDTTLWGAIIGCPIEREDDRRSGETSAHGDQISSLKNFS